MSFNKEKYKRLKELGLICPNCDSYNVITRREDRIRYCRRCGEEWK
jgi:ribosomal protein L37AE/L43A